MLTSRLLLLPLAGLQPDPAAPGSRPGLYDAQHPLVRSIRRHGMLQPLAVTPLGDGQYRLLDGHRRYRAARALGLEEVPCRVYADLTPAERQTLRAFLPQQAGAWRAQPHRTTDRSLEALMAADSEPERAVREEAIV